MTSNLLSQRGYDHSIRDMPGYGSNPPNPKWPNNAKIAVSFVLNYEEGGEHCILNGDSHPEAFLTEGGASATVVPPKTGSRNLGVESAYEFGSHRGFYRILDLFKRKKLRFTSWAVGSAVEKNPQVVSEMEKAGCEVASHSYKWIDYSDVPEEEERDHVRKTIETLMKNSKDGKSFPKGWYTGRMSLQTRRLVYETYHEMGFLKDLYDSDAYDEDLPYWVNSPSPKVSKSPLLVIPYTLDNNDMKFAQSPGFFNSNAFFEYLRDAFDTLHEEGERGSPRMMSIGLHCRVVGRPGRFKGLERFIDHIQSKEGVWVATREELAAHWRENFPPPSTD